MLHPNNSLQGRRLWPWFLIRDLLGMDERCILGARVEIERRNRRGESKRI